MDHRRRRLCDEAPIGEGPRPIDIFAELTNTGTLLAFLVVCMGVLVLRYTPPTFLVRFASRGRGSPCTIGANGREVLIVSLPHATWLRMFIWSAIGLVSYFAYGIRHSRLGRSQQTAPSRADGNNHAR